MGAHPYGDDVRDLAPRAVQYLDMAAVPRILSRIGALADRWTEITDVDLVRDRAERLLAQNQLQAADALQLAAALVLTRERPRNRDFITADGDLARAAGSEGFRVVVPGLLAAQYGEPQPRR